MKVTELMIALASLPGDLEVVLDMTGPEDGDFFKLEVVTTLDTITTSDNEQFVIINCPPGKDEFGDDDDDE